MSDGLLVLPLDELHHVLGLPDHSVVLVVEFFHAEDVVGAGLFRELQGLLDLLVCALFKQEELFLNAFNFFFKLTDSLFMG